MFDNPVEVAFDDEPAPTVETTPFPPLPDIAKSAPAVSDDIVPDFSALRMRDDSPLVENIRALVSPLSEFHVVNQETYNGAAQIVQQLMAGEKWVHDEYDEDCRTLDRLHKKWTGKRAMRLGMIEPHRRRIQIEMGAWEDEQERKAREEARRLEEKARAKAEAEREQEAQSAEQSGEFEEAEAIREAPFQTPVVSTTALTPSFATGARGRRLSGPQRNVVEVTDLKALVLAVAEKLKNPKLAGPPLSILKIDQAELNRFVSIASEWAGCAVVKVRGSSRNL